MAVRIVARWGKPEDRGVGDTVHRHLTIAGKDVIGWMLGVLKIPCGCADDRIWLNARFPYSR